MLEIDNPPLDAEDWDIVFQPYEEYPILAFILAQHLDCLKGFLCGGREGKLETIAAIDRAIECLMPHTDFRDAGRTVYLLAIAGNLVPKDEELLRELLSPSQLH